MKLKSIAQKDIYVIDFVTGQIMVTKSDGKVWFIPIADVKMITDVLSKKEHIEFLQSEIERITSKT